MHLWKPHRDEHAVSLMTLHRSVKQGAHQCGRAQPQASGSLVCRHPSPQTNPQGTPSAMQGCSVSAAQAPVCQTCAQTRTAGPRPSATGEQRGQCRAAKADGNTRTHLHTHVLHVLPHRHAELSGPTGLAVRLAVLLTRVPKQRRQREGGIAADVRQRLQGPLLNIIRDTTSCQCQHVLVKRASKAAHKRGCRPVADCACEKARHASRFVLPARISTVNINDGTQKARK